MPAVIARGARQHQHCNCLAGPTEWHVVGLEAAALFLVTQDVRAMQQGTLTRLDAGRQAWS